MFFILYGWWAGISLLMKLRGSQDFSMAQMHHLLIKRTLHWFVFTSHKLCAYPLDMCGFKCATASAAYNGADDGPVVMKILTLIVYGPCVGIAGLSWCRSCVLARWGLIPLRHIVLFQNHWSLVVETCSYGSSVASLNSNVFSHKLDEKVNAHLPYYSTLKKFWNGFFQTFQAGLLFFSGGSLPCDSWLLLTSIRLSHPFLTNWAGIATVWAFSQDACKIFCPLTYLRGDCLTGDVLDIVKVWVRGSRHLARCLVVVLEKELVSTVHIL